MSFFSLIFCCSLSFFSWLSDSRTNVETCWRCWSSWTLELGRTRRPDLPRTSCSKQIHSPRWECCQVWRVCVRRVLHEDDAAEAIEKGSFYTRTNIGVVSHSQRILSQRKHHLLIDGRVIFTTGRVVLILWGTVDQGGGTATVRGNRA